MINLHRLWLYVYISQSHIVTSWQCLCSLTGLTCCSLRMESVPLFFFLTVYCSVVDSQCCVSFRCTAKSVGYTYIYFFFFRLFSPVGHYMDVVMYMSVSTSLSPPPPILLCSRTWNSCLIIVNWAILYSSGVICILFTWAEVIYR